MEKISVHKKIIINGVTYNSEQEIPEEFKKFIEDKNNNGVPDFVEGTENIKNVTIKKEVVTNYENNLIEKNESFFSRVKKALRILFGN